MFYLALSCLYLAGCFAIIGFGAATNHTTDFSRVMFVAFFIVGLVMVTIALTERIKHK